MLRYTLFFLLTLICFSFAGKYDATVKAFADRSEYVTPLATVLGTMGNSGWNSASSIAKEPYLHFSLPISIVVISKKDRSYDGVYIDDGLLNSAELDKSAATQNYTTPTIFGREPAPVVYKYVTNTKGMVTDTIIKQFSDGLDDLKVFNWIPFTSLQCEASMHYTSLKTIALCLIFTSGDAIAQGRRRRRNLYNHRPCGPGTFAVLSRGKTRVLECRTCAHNTFRPDEKHSAENCLP